MKKMLHVPLEEIQMIPATTKTGRISKTHKTWNIVKVADEQECESFDVMVGGKKVTVWIPTETMERVTERNYRFTQSVAYTEDGEKIMANWQHGRYGMEVHTEPALFDWVKKEFVRITDYCDGRVRDSNKYLLKVLI